MSIYLTFHRTEGVGATLIRAQSPGSWPNHVGVGIGDEQDISNMQIYEAQAKAGVVNKRTIGQAIASGDEVEVYKTLASPMEVAAAFNFLQQQLGKPYDKIGLSIFIPLSITQAIAKQSQRKADKAWWCSELVQGMSQKWLFPLLTNIQPWQVTPHHLHISPAKDLIFAHRK